MKHWSVRVLLSAVVVSIKETRRIIRRVSLHPVVAMRDGTPDLVLVEVPSSCLRQSFIRRSAASTLLHWGRRAVFAQRTPR